MADGQFILHIRKVIVNPLLGRKQCVRTSLVVFPEAIFPLSNFPLLSNVLSHFDSNRLQR